MTKQRKKVSAPSESEWAVMNVMWDAGPMAVRDIYQRLSEERDWAYPTVKTLVRRLVEKGWLSYQEVGNSFLYRAAVTQKKAVRSAVKDFSERVLNGLLSPFVAYYADEKGLRPQELEELEDIIRKHRARGGQ